MKTVFIDLQKPPVAILSMLSLIPLLTGTAFTINASCLFDSTHTAVVHLDILIPDAAAWAWYNDSLNESGWANIRIKTNKNYSSEDQMYCAGYIDTYLSNSRIRDAYVMMKVENKLKPEDPWNSTWVHWMDQNIQYIEEKTAKPTDQYWKDMGLIYRQVIGMLDGYNAQRRVFGQNMSLNDMWMFQSSGDMDDLTTVWGSDNLKDPELAMHCTGLVKILPDYSDIYFSQDTWSSYTELNAILKEYQINIPEFSAHTVSVSTRAGHLPSSDDFWITDQGLFILETTMHCFNLTLYNYVTPNSVLTWMRAYYASFIATSGKNWTDEFIRENSGTYNNEYLVLDAKKFQKGVKPTSDLLWMIEQYPTIYESKDMTQDLLNLTYWPSINAPYFPDLFKIADYPGQEQREPNKAKLWSYYEQPRFKILQRDAPTIKNYDQFKTLMRYNNWPRDSLQEDYGMGILSRYDLRPENGSSFGSRNCFGGLDSKTCKISEAYGNLLFDAINSPQYETQPVFDFKNWPTKAHPGLPDVWKFNWTEFSSSSYDRCNKSSGEQDCLNKEFCGWCIYSQQCYPGSSKDTPNRGYECEDGWEIKTVEPSYAKPLVITVCVIVVAFVGFIYGAHYYNKKHNEYQEI